MSSISDDLDRDYAPAWRPKPGDKLIGTVTELSEREGFNGETYPIVTVRVDEGDEFSFHAFHRVASSELAKLRPKVGDPIGIKYQGEVASENSRSRYHSYRLLTAGGSSGVNWDRYGGDDAARSDVQQVQKEADDADIPF